MEVYRCLIVILKIKDKSVAKTLPFCFLPFKENIRNTSRKKKGGGDLNRKLKYSSYDSSSVFVGKTKTKQKTETCHLEKQNKFMI